MTNYLVLSQLTLDAIQAEAIRAHNKHGKNSLVNPNMHWSLKLAALMEEVGEVAHELTYDINDSKSDLVKELIQVAGLAAAWVESLEGNSFDS